jgi:hypothetical protein
MKLLIDRESVCMGDDCESHKKCVEVAADELFRTVVEQIVADGYLARFASGKGTWIVETGPSVGHVSVDANGVHHFFHEKRPSLAVIAQQWPHPLYLVSLDSRIDAVVEESLGLYLACWGLVDPHLVWYCLKNHLPLPDKYGRVTEGAKA